ncbi:MAG: hypothetical protein COA38_21485 [Fluviicola sp.]|nr:MAG: hypothetical protein COA38_21485 [Fluviicola sp.]
MLKSILTTVVLSAVAITNSLNAQGSVPVTIDNTDVTNPPATSCTNTFYTVSGVMANTNYGYSGPTINVVGFNVTIEMNYFTGFIPLPGLTPYTEDMDLGVLPAGTYTVNTATFVDGNPSDTDTGTFDVTSCCPVIADFALSSLTTCSPDSVWTTNSSTAATDYTWYVDGTFLTNSTDTDISPVTAGMHTIKLVANDGSCADSMELTIEVFIPNPVNLGADTTICPGDTILLDVTTTMATYEWQDGSTDATFMVQAIGDYSVTVTDSNGCESFDTITFTQCSVGLNEINNSESITMFPNPAISTIQLLGVNGNSTISIYTLAGKLVAVHSNTTTIDVSNLQAGGYLVKIEQMNNTITKRLIIQE